MNNKMALGNFLDAGGLVEIRLRRELRHLGFNEIYFAANSLESARTMALRLRTAECNLQKIIHRRDLSIDMFVDSIVFCWDRTLYELGELHPPLIKLFTWPENRYVQESGRILPYYLIAKNKCL